MHIKKPTVVKAAGNKPKIIEEFIGRINTGTDQISIAHMTSPAGWEEPPQTPDFVEYTYVIRGIVHVKISNETITVGPNEVFVSRKGQTVQYSTPEEGGAEYIAVCMPAFSEELAGREE